MNSKILLCGLSIFLLATMVSCRSVGGLIEREAERKIAEITEEQLDEMIDKKISSIFFEFLPESILALIASGLGLKLSSIRKSRKKSESA